MLGPFVATLLLAPLALAAPRAAVTPAHNIEQPGATPIHNAPAQPSLLPRHAIAPMLKRHAIERRAFLEEEEAHLIARSMMEAPMMDLASGDSLVARSSEKSKLEAKKLLAKAKARLAEKKRIAGPDNFFGGFNGFNPFQPPAQQKKTTTTTTTTTKKTTTTTTTTTKKTTTTTTTKPTTTKTTTTTTTTTKPATTTTTTSSKAPSTTSSVPSSSVVVVPVSSSASSVTSSSLSLSSSVLVLQSTTATTTTSSAIASASANATALGYDPTQCLGSSTNATEITSLFYYGGVGTTVYLCPNANITIVDSIYFTAAQQTLATLGLPTDNTRATITVTGANQTNAIYGAIDNTHEIALRNVQIDGNRENMGIYADGPLALIEFGGNNYGQIIDNVHAYEPRGWSCLHGIEGYQNSCRGMVVTNNQIGPSGHAPSDPDTQFRKRDNTGTYSPGQWADGISMACGASTVKNNVITDATDGAIVIFQSPDSVFSGNTIKTVNRQLLGGINMVDWAPWGGNFTGVVVENNNIIAESNYMKVGIPMGGMTWGTDNRTIARQYGGTVRNNKFSSGATGFFGFAIGVTGYENATITGNDASAANFGGEDTGACFTDWFPLPSPQAWVLDPTNTPGISQTGWFLRTLVLLICRGPTGGVVSSGATPATI